MESIRSTGTPSGMAPTTSAASAPASDAAVDTVQIGATGSPSATGLRASPIPLQTVLAPPSDHHSWGERSQIMATMQDMKDALGDKDGLWSQDGEGPVGRLTDRNPLTLKLKEAMDLKLSREEATGLLTDFLDHCERVWGERISDLMPGDLKHGSLFLVQKAVALTRLGRKPEQVTDAFVQASGSVDGHSIADRKVFTQRFRPSGTPSGKIVVVSPGFQETGRNFYEQIRDINAQGHDVIVMDHQWAGQTDGTSGELDRGFGAARDVAAVAAYANTLVQQDYKGVAGAQVILFGNSMGAGPGVLGALVMNDNDRIQLKGPPMPKGLNAVLESPFLAPSPNLVNFGLGMASHAWPINEVSMPSAGLPNLTTDPVAAEKSAQSAVLEADAAKMVTMTAAAHDLDRILGLIGSGHGPQGRLFVVHADHDPLADPAKSRWLKAQLGSTVELNEVHSRNHVMEQSPSEQRYATEGLKRLLACIAQP